MFIYTVIYNEYMPYEFDTDTTLFITSDRVQAILVAQQQTIEKSIEERSYFYDKTIAVTKTPLDVIGVRAETIWTTAPNNPFSEVMRKDQLLVEKHLKELLHKEALPEEAEFALRAANDLSLKAYAIALGSDFSESDANSPENIQAWELYDTYEKAFSMR